MRAASVLMPSDDGSWFWAYAHLPETIDMRLDLLTTIPGSAAITPLGDRVYKNEKIGCRAYAPARANRYR